jgi:hypothetical protein
MGVSKKEIKRQNEERLGEETCNNFGTRMKIVKYNGARDIVVEFQDEYKEKIHTSYKDFIIRNVRNPYDKSVFNIGCLGVGDYKTKENGKMTKCYITWFNMLMRCYDPYYINKHTSYIDCFVCDEWLNFQNFAKWFYENYYEVKEDRMELDKDILCKGNKIYSPQTCVFVPKRINTLLVKNDVNRGEYPIGVYYYKRTNKLKIQCSIYKNNKKKRISLGYFPLNKPFQAFTCYKQFKESYIKQVANEYKDKIPQKLYDAMYSYKIEIND